MITFRTFLLSLHDDGRNKSKSINMEENTKFNRIKVSLVENHKTSKWLAEQMGKSDTTVSRWVSNKIQPSVEQLFEIAKILNVDVKDLLNSNIKQ